jgi:hypothetical protein
MEKVGISHYAYNWRCNTSITGMLGTKKDTMIKVQYRSVPGGEFINYRADFPKPLVRK